jgi:hypothetical protein
LNRDCRFLPTFVISSRLSFANDVCHPFTFVIPSEPAAVNARVLQLSADVESSDSLLKQLEGNSGIEQRAQKHAAADSREAFEIGNADGGCPDSSS